MTKRPRPSVHARDHVHGGTDPVRITYESVGAGSGEATGFSKVKWGDGLAVTDEGGGVIRVDGSGGPASADAFAISCGSFTPTDYVTSPFDFSDGFGSVLSGSTGSAFSISGGVVSITKPGFYVCTLYATVSMAGVPTANESFIIELVFNGDIGYGIEPTGGTPTPSSPLWTVVFPAGTSDAFEASLQRTRPLSVTAGMPFPLVLEPYLRITNPAAGTMSFDRVALWGYRVSGDLGPDVSN